MISLAYIGIGLGVALVVIGAAYGIGKIGHGAVEGMSRQPEAAGSIQTAMIISAALIEGATMFGLVILLLAALGLGDVAELFAPAEPAPIVETQE